MIGTALLDRECVMCGVPMVRYEGVSVPCPDGRPGCCVNHLSDVVACPKCQGRAYSYTATPTRPREDA